MIQVHFHIINMMKAIDVWMVTVENMLGITVYVVTVCINSSIKITIPIHRTDTTCGGALNVWTGKLEQMEIVKNVN